MFKNINNNGTRIATGYYPYFPNGTCTSYVKVHDFSNNSWSLSATISGENASDYAGVVSMNLDGTIIAVGESKYDGYSTDCGRIRVYKFNSSNKARCYCSYSSSTKS